MQTIGPRYIAGISTPIPPARSHAAEARLLSFKYGCPSSSSAPQREQPSHKARSKMPLLPPKVRNAGIVELPDAPPATPLQAEAAKGTELALNALRTTEETHQVAVATAEALQSQTEQLRRIHDGIENTHDILDSTEVVVEKLTRSKIKRVVVAPFRRGRKPNEIPDENVRKEGSETSEDGATQKGILKKIRVGRKKEQVEEKLSVGDIVESYEEFEDESVREQLKVQDKYLNQMGVRLGELKELAGDIENELEVQAEIVESIDAPELTERIKKNRVKINQKFRL